MPNLKNVIGETNNFLIESNFPFIKWNPYLKRLLKQVTDIKGEHSIVILINRYRIKLTSNDSLLDLLINTLFGSQERNFLMEQMAINIGTYN